MSIIDIEYISTKDYSVLNTNKFLKIDKIQNLILIPNIIENNSFFNIKPTDIVSINNTKQKVALDSGFIDLNNNSYFYFYIAPGIKQQVNKIYSLEYSGQSIKLDMTLSTNFTAKFVFGLLVLPDNYYYLYHNQKKLILSDGIVSYETQINNIINKHNFYMANKNNTLIFILNSYNFKQLQLINQKFSNNYFIKPLYNINYPLGKLQISIKGVKDKYGINIKSSKYNKNFLVDTGKPLIIDDLPFGQYTIQVYNKDGIVIIGKSNEITINSNSIDIEILQSPGEQTTNSSLQQFYSKNKPQQDKANLLVNLPLNESFEIFGPNNFTKQFTSGYQYLQNIDDGYYNIKTNNNTKTFYVIKNDNNYIS